MSRNSYTKLMRRCKLATAQIASVQPKLTHVRIMQHQALARRSSCESHRCSIFKNQQAAKGRDDGASTMVIKKKSTACLRLALDVKTLPDAPPCTYEPALPVAAVFRHLKNFSLQRDKAEPCHQNLCWAGVSWIAHSQIIRSNIAGCRLS